LKEHPLLDAPHAQLQIRRINAKAMTIRIAYAYVFGFARGSLYHPVLSDCLVPNLCRRENEFWGRVFVVFCQSETSL
jgi:hypothetical protein